MFTPAQRTQILTWSSYTFVISNVLLVVVHGLFYLPVMTTYLQLAIIGALGYYGYKKGREIWQW